MINNLLERPEKIEMHKLTYEGVRKFETVINDLRKEIKYKKDNKIKNSVDTVVLELIEKLPNILQEDSYKIKNSPIIDLTIKHPTRFELSKYLYSTLDKFVTEKKLAQDPYFWTWLALVYFEDLTNGLLKVNKPNQFITEISPFKFSKKVKKLYQHSIREGFLMYKKYKDESKIYFSQEGLGSMGDVWEQVRSRGDIRRHIGIHNYIIKKYSDPKGSGFASTNTATEGFIDSIRRLGTSYLRISVNYAAPLCDVYDYANLLGPGFELED